MTRIRKREECGGETRKGTPCKAKVYVKGEHCGLHGGATESQKKSTTPDRAALVLASLGEVEPIRNPIVALELLAGEAMRAVAIMRQKVSELSNIRYEGEHGEQIRGEVQVWLSLIARAESINAKIVALGLYERRVKVEEKQAEAITFAVRAILEGHGIKSDEFNLPLIRENLEAIDGTCEEIEDD